jgi:hypothetical protein
MKTKQKKVTKSLAICKMKHEDLIKIRGGAGSDLAGSVQ